MSVLVSNDSQMFNALAARVDCAKAKPDKLSHCCVGIDIPSHIATVSFVRSARIDLLHLPYTGSAPSPTDPFARVIPVPISSAVWRHPHCVRQTEAAGGIGAPMAAEIARCPCAGSCKLPVKVGVMPGRSHASPNMRNPGAPADFRVARPASVSTACVDPQTPAVTWVILTNLYSYHRVRGTCNFPSSRHAPSRGGGVRSPRHYRGPQARPHQGRLVRAVRRRCAV
jgi:Tripartite tricarboxylate transporter family receptor